MSTTQTENPTSYDELLQDVQQLPPFELQQFTLKVIELQAQQKAPSLSQEETELMLKINEGLPAKIRLNYTTLVKRRENETLTEEEYKELLRLTEQIEQMEADRMEHLSKLSLIRRIPLASLMDGLGIKSPGYA